jgi:hypothetical protein
MFGAAGIRRDKGQIDVGLHGGGELHFGLFGSLFEPLQRHFIGPQVNTLIFLEFTGQVIDQSQIEIFAAEMGVAVGGFDLEDPLADLQNGNVKVPPPRSKRRFSLRCAYPGRTPEKPQWVR